MTRSTHTLLLTLCLVSAVGCGDDVDPVMDGGEDSAADAGGEDSSIDAGGEDSNTDAGGEDSATDATTGDSAMEDSAVEDSGGEDATTEDASAEDSGAIDECPQAADFLDVSTGSAGDGYPTPSLAVTCEDDEVVARSNGIPNFEFTQITPNALVEQAFEFRFPREPAMAAATTRVPLVGAVAVAVNGLPIFGPTENPMMDYRDPTVDEILDFCFGHTAGGGIYHFHARPDCLFTDLEGNTSLVVAYAFDGYPILAPFECVDERCTETRELSSSWQRVAESWDGDEPDYAGTEEGSWDIFEYTAGSGDLDECNGREQPDGSYAYHSTDTFPYFIGCYRGTPTVNRLGGGGMMMGGDVIMCGEPMAPAACCGNDVCNPMRGETPATCPSDCP